MTKQKIEKVTQKELIRVFNDFKKNSQQKFCFLLGAGASYSSGIPTGGMLAQKWFEELKENLNPQELNSWCENEKIELKKLAASYSKIYRKRFIHPIQGEIELQQQMEDKTPNVGYLLLAQLLSAKDSLSKFVITTNFDYLIEDALRYTFARPLVCGHEFLADYINVHSQRPTIIKVHRDLLLTPFNTDNNLSHLKEQWQTALTPLLAGHTLIVLGYGGHDDSIMNFLLNIKNRKPIYWCHLKTDDIHDKIQNVLRNEYDAMVEIESFDDFMWLLNEEVFKFKSLADEIKANAIHFAETYQTQFNALAGKNADKNTNIEEKQKEARSFVDFSGLTEEQANDWWQWQLIIDAETDNNKKDELYQKALAVFFEKAKLNGNYALFLETIRKDYDQAEVYYLKALELEPNDANFNNNYANFLYVIRKDYDQAERFYLKALELEPNNADFNNNYANLLYVIRKDYDQAERYYLKTLELEPNDADSNNNYACFLSQIRKNYTEAETYYLKVLKLESNNVIFNGNYAQFLLAQSKTAEAEKHLAIALKSDAKDLLLECCFYRLAHYPEYKIQALNEIETLLAKGVRSMGWDFSANIEQAEREGFNDIALLKSLAQRISTE